MLGYYFHIAIFFTVLYSGLLSVVVAQSNPSPSPSDEGPLVGWKVKLNATWEGTNCDNINGLLPILRSQIDFGKYFDDESVLNDAMTCRNFGKCQGSGRDTKYVANFCIDLLF